MRRFLVQVVVLVCGVGCAAERPPEADREERRQAVEAVGVALRWSR